MHSRTLPPLDVKRNIQNNQIWPIIILPCCKNKCGHSGGCCIRYGGCENGDSFVCTDIHQEGQPEMDIQTFVVDCHDSEIGAIQENFPGICGII